MRRLAVFSIFIITTVFFISCIKSKNSASEYNIVIWEQEDAAVVSTAISTAAKKKDHAKTLWCLLMFQMWWNQYMKTESVR